MFEVMGLTIIILKSRAIFIPFELSAFPCSVIFYYTKFLPLFYGGSLMFYVTIETCSLSKLTACCFT